MEMLVATKVNMRGSKQKGTRCTNISSIKRVTRKFMEVYVVVVQKKKNGKEMYKKGVLHMQSCFFANLT